MRRLPCTAQQTSLTLYKLMFELVRHKFENAHVGAADLETFPSLWWRTGKLIINAWLKGAYYGEKAAGERLRAAADISRRSGWGS